LNAIKEIVIGALAEAFCFAACAAAQDGDRRLAADNESQPKVQINFRISTLSLMCTRADPN
jgi:hypothetical protein